MFGISKRGDRYLRTLLIPGARSALRWAQDKPDHSLRWALTLKEAKGFNVAAVALASKIARVAWAMLVHGRHYDAQWIGERAQAMYGHRPASEFALKAVRHTTIAKGKNEQCPTGKTDAGTLRLM